MILFDYSGGERSLWRSSKTMIISKNTLKGSALIPVLTTLILFISAAAQAQNTTYVWTSTDGDPYGLAGTIVLDSPSSAGGTVSDIVSMTLSDTDSGTYYVNLAVDYLDFFPPFTWNSSQITAMNILENPPTMNQYFAVAENPDQPGDNFIYDLKAGDLDESGSWVAVSTVPEPTTLALACFGGLSILLRRRQ
jgi:hypothetical protein